MAKPEHGALVRQRAVEACLKRFDNKPRQYGSSDCVKAAALVLRSAKVSIPFLKGKTYGSKTKALSILRDAGFETLVEAVDALGLERLPGAAFTLPGDIIAMPVDEGDPFGAALYVVHSAGARRAFGVEPVSEVFRVGVPDLNRCLAAWRVPYG